jgi:hypothetical protein
MRAIFFTENTETLGRGNIKMGLKQHTGLGRGLKNYNYYHILYSDTGSMGNEYKIFTG